MATVTVVQIEYECDFAFIFNESGATTHLALYCYYGILAGKTMGTMVNVSVFYYGGYMCRIRTRKITQNKSINLFHTHRIHCTLFWSEHLPGGVPEHTESSKVKQEVNNYHMHDLRPNTAKSAALIWITMRNTWRSLRSFQYCTFDCTQMPNVQNTFHTRTNITCESHSARSVHFISEITHLSYSSECLTVSEDGCSVSLRDPDVLLDSDTHLYKSC